MWGCDGLKAPGPDGFNFNFIRKAWSLLKEDIMNAFHKFFQFGSLPGGANASFITLIPKVSNPTKLEDFRPISLISSLYKIFAKVLTSRLKSVIGKVISDNQSAFVGGRQITDGILMAWEVIDELEKKKTSGFVLKLDFEKAYDYVNWEFYCLVKKEWDLGRNGVIGSGIVFRVSKFLF